ncbi:MAG TPA: DNA methyltransferase [Pyrinomonadaceae bacterium]|jgi:putative DNA methylase
MSAIVINHKDQPGHQSPPQRQERAIECDFPISQISQLAEQESWRKEVHRPIYHIHKWWAQRLGSVFRAMILGGLADSNTDIWMEFYKRHDFAGKVVLDPFMGSGTTLGECAKLGAKPIGIDINPVSTFIVAQSLTRVDINKLEKVFTEIEADIKHNISHYYKTLDPGTGGEIPVLYYFWVMQVTTPSGETIPLFSSYVFSKDAYPKKKPTARIICPSCWSINTGRYDATDLVCTSCSYRFNPQAGPVQGQYVTASSGETYKIKDLVLQTEEAPGHRLYALMALKSDGTKVYLAPGSYDFDLLEEARAKLQDESLPLPDMTVRPGHNTNQARGYNYHNWSDFFNERQLLCLGILLRRILLVKDKAIRNQFLCLFSSTLEYNNLFCSFKGEGTGAVRPLFSHHILKPERAVLENNVWGTEKSSGTFSTLFRSRLLKAKQYLDTPFEVGGVQSLFDNGNGAGNGKVVSSSKIDLTVTDAWDEFSGKSKAALVLNGDGAELPIPDKSVDAVITDPPYFDFVHYSELSDFFYAWLAPVLKQDYGYFCAPDSSHNHEVQGRDPERFSEKLARVFRECHRVLKDDGVLSFSFHHSRAEGWLSIYQAITNAGFQIVAAHPIYGEMKGASPKSSTKEPITLDAILVCKKSTGIYKHVENVVETVRKKTEIISRELGSSGFTLSQADTYVVAMSQALASGSCTGYSSSEMSALLSQFTLQR